MSKDQPLYRVQVRHEQQSSRLGTVLLAAPPSTATFALVGTVVILAFAAILGFGSYTSKVRVGGLLVAEQGQARVLASQAGVVTELYVKEGDKVVEGQPLLVISAEQRSAAVGATQAEIVKLLRTRRTSLLAERTHRQRLLKQQLAGYKSRIAALRREIQELGRETRVQTERTRLVEQSAQRQRDLLGRGFVSLAQSQQQEEMLLEQRGRLSTLQRERAERSRELIGMRAEADELPLRTQSGLLNLDREISAVDQEIALSEARRELVVTASQAGVVTAMQIESGSAAETGVPLLSIIPEGARLVAHLFGASRAMGFVQTGQTVKLSYAAYPYQKFGHHPGMITAVSRTAISPAEMPRELTGLSKLMTGTEPVYRISVAPETQQVLAYGEQYRLRPGMQLEADILIESRRLWEWVLDPLYTMTGRL
ncbi:MAG: HlyD family efflux transporter periplasmic adaptor subunit [Burkholderiaceae bacterium]